MLSIEDKEICRDIAARVRIGGFFNDKDALQMLRIIKRLDVVCDQLKKEFGKMAVQLEDSYNQRLKARMN